MKVARVDMPTKGKCAARVYKRDTYRYTGRTKSGFEMYYVRCQCSRKATHGDLCKQHHRLHETWERNARGGRE